MVTGAIGLLVVGPAFLSPACRRLSAAYATSEAPAPVAVDPAPVPPPAPGVAAALTGAEEVVGGTGQGR